MKLKSLLFGSAAAIVTVTGAQAADLPIAEPVEYVRICDAYGAGYYYIPGTETCLRISGFVRADFTYADFDVEEDADFFEGGSFFGDYLEYDDEDFNNYSTLARASIRLDARTQTSLGILRSYIEIWSTVGAEDYDDSYGDSFSANQAFIQLLMDAGTLTAGHAASFFDFSVTEAYANRLGDNDPTTEANLLAYTFAFGNGFSATLSLEDRKSAGRVYEDPFSGKIYEAAGQEYPDLVANIRVDQGWGSAQIMGAVGKVEGIGFDVPDDDDDDGEWGWAVGAGVKVEVPNTMFVAGLVAEYARGLVGYVTTADYVYAVDAYYDLDGTFELGEAWRVEAMIGAQVSSTFGLYLSGTYAEANYDSSVADYELSSDSWTLALTGAWEPVDGLLIGPEIAYVKADVDYSDFDVDDDDDDYSEDVDAWSAMLRIQRSF